jgi:hypothetical protein
MMWYVSQLVTWLLFLLKRFSNASYPDVFLVVFSYLCKIILIKNWLLGILLMHYLYNLRVAEDCVVYVVLIRVLMIRA